MFIIVYVCVSKALFTIGYTAIHVTVCSYVSEVVYDEYCIVLIALSRCNRVFTRRLRLCHSHTVYRREVREGDREGPSNRLESEV